MLKDGLYEQVINKKLDTVKTTLTSDKIKYVDEPEIPFPQADSFKRVINLCELINDSEVTAEKITEEFEFDPRQTQYYTRAAMYLGLIDKCSEGKHVTYKLSAIGKEIMKMKYVQRQLEFVKLILFHKVFHVSFVQYLYAGRQLSKKEVVAFMKSHTVSEILANIKFWGDDYSYLAEEMKDADS